jgi:hypothetical protein
LRPAQRQHLWFQGYNCCLRTIRVHQSAPGNMELKNELGLRGDGGFQAALSLRKNISLEGVKLLVNPLDLLSHGFVPSGFRGSPCRTFRELHLPVRESLRDGTD